MVHEVVYTDGACNGNGTNHSTGGFGLFISNSKVFEKPIKVNQKGKHTKYNYQTMYVTNIRMEGLAIVATFAIYANILINKVKPKDVFNHMNQNDPFDFQHPKIIYGANELKQSISSPNTEIEIVTDSLFWMNVIQKWMPNWIKKNDLLNKKNPDILLMLCYYLQLFEQNDIKFKFTHVRSHQKGTRSFHADGNDVADELATAAVRNTSDGFVIQM